MVRKYRGSLTPHNGSNILNLEFILKMRNIVNPAANLTKIGISGSTSLKRLKGNAVLIFHQLTFLIQNKKNQMSVTEFLGVKVSIKSIYYYEPINCYRKNRNKCRRMLYA